MLSGLGEPSSYNGYQINIIGKTETGEYIVQESLKTGVFIGGNLNTFYEDLKYNGGTTGTIAKIGGLDSSGLVTNYVIGKNQKEIEAGIVKQKDLDVKIAGYNLALVGCTISLGGCASFGNEMYSDTMNAFHPENYGDYNFIRGTVETGVKIVGVPEKYQGIVTDVGYFWAGSKLAEVGKWEDVGSTLNNLKIPGLTQNYEVVAVNTGSGTVTYKVPKNSSLDDLKSNTLEATTNKGNGGAISNNTSGSNQVNGAYQATPKHDPVYGWGSKNPIPNDEVGQTLLNNAYKVDGGKQVYTLYEGQVIKFQPDPASGTMHPYLVKNTSSKEVPKQVYEMMLEDGVITRAQYTKLINNKWNK